MLGRFIVLEGIDGCGKTTQARLLAQRLRRKGRKVLTLREPGGTPLSEKIRKLLLHARNAPIASRAELFLFMAGRAQLVDQVILPALQAGQIVLCDRYYYSTAAYQGAGGHLGIDEVLLLAERIARFPKPDLAIVLDLPARAALARIHGPKDRIESKGVAYMERTRRGFLHIARRDPGHVTVVRGTHPVEKLAEEIYQLVRRLL